MNDRQLSSDPNHQRGFLSLEWDWPEIIGAAVFAALVLLLIWGIREEIRENRAWAVWANEHACKVIGHMQGSTSTGIGPSTGGNGGVAVVTTSIPGKIGYQCDDGQQYWRNE